MSFQLPKRPKISVVFTGGPGGGKTTLLAETKLWLERQGLTVLVVPEVPTLLYNSGFRFSKVPEEFKPRRDQLILDIHLHNLTTYQGLASLLDGSVVVIYDRGPLDMISHIGELRFHGLLKKHDLNKVELRDCYSSIIHLETAAHLGADSYHQTTNPARRENAKEAVEQDDLLWNAWQGHPYLHRVKASENIDTKFLQIKKCLSDQLSLS